jgi:mitochondrial import receptor subunit TOM70
MTSSSGSSPIPKWQLALVVGAPVALGLGYMYYRNKNSSSGSKVDKPERDRFRSGAAARENGAPADKQISIDGDCKVPSPATESEVEIACLI